MSQLCVFLTQHDILFRNGIHFHVFLMIFVVFQNVLNENINIQKFNDGILW